MYEKKLKIMKSKQKIKRVNLKKMDIISRELSNKIKELLPQVEMDPQDRLKELEKLKQMNEQMKKKIREIQEEQEKARKKK